MPLYTKEEIKAKIEALDAKIAKAESEQAYTSGGPGGGMVLRRGDLEAMYRERQYWLKEYERLEALEQGGLIAKVTWRRPR